MRRLAPSSPTTTTEPPAGNGRPRGRRIAQALLLTTAIAAGCNDVAGIAAPILDEDVVPCEALPECEAAVPVCYAATGCTDGFCAFTEVPEVACYEGAAGTENVGACHGGTRTCDFSKREYGSCEGQVVPSAERCGDGAGVDEDCDGQVDEGGEGCTCGDGIQSAEMDEECDDQNQVDDDACSNACKVARCGDGTVQAVTGEQCDDGGVADGDACSPDCQKQEVLELATGTSHTCALLSGGRVKCWGKNDVGQLGLGDAVDRGDDPGEMGSALPFVDLGSGVRATALSAGNCHTCALLSDGSAKCWGCNNAGQLGLGDNVGRGGMAGEMGDALAFVDLGTGVKAKAIVAGYDHTCALLATGAVKCWGRNARGQLGLGDKGNRGDQPGEMGDALPFVVLNSSDAPVEMLSLGREHSCVLIQGGQIKCWGRNEFGELGLGDKNDRGDEPNEMGDSLPAVDLGFNALAASVAAGHLSTCALLSGGTAKCWGRNDQGQLGLGDKNDRGDEPNEMGDSLPAVDLGGGKTPVVLSGGGNHTCALLAEQAVKCWGDAGAGQLGLGDKNDRGDEPNEMGDSLPAVDLGAGAAVVAVAAGPGRTCARLADGSARCWGRNDLGQLGLGDKVHRGDDPGEMGSALPPVKLFSDLW